MDENGGPATLNDITFYGSFARFHSLVVVNKSKINNRSGIAILGPSTSATFMQFFGTEIYCSLLCVIAQQLQSANRCS
jgi:hypothetical protein